MTGKFIILFSHDSVLAYDQNIVLKLQISSLIIAFNAAFCNMQWKLYSFFTSSYLVYTVISLMMLIGMEKQDQVCRICVVMFGCSLAGFLCTSLDMELLDL